MVMKNSGLTFIEERSNRSKFLHSEARYLRFSAFKPFHPLKFNPRSSRQCSLRDSKVIWISLIFHSPGQCNSNLTLFSNDYMQIVELIEKFTIINKNSILKMFITEIQILAGSQSIRNQPAQFKIRSVRILNPIQIHFVPECR